MLQTPAMGVTRAGARGAAATGKAQRAHLEQRAENAAKRFDARETRIAVDAGTTYVASAPAHVTGSGSPLPAELRDRLERAFGAQLGAVRVHSDRDAALAVD